MSEETPQNQEAVANAAEPGSPYTSEQATASLHRASWLVVGVTLVGLPLAWYLAGWRSALLLLIGGLISASGLWEWQRLMAALMARMDAQDAVQATATGDRTDEAEAAQKRPSIAFAIAGFIVRLLVVMVVLYVSLKYLHGSVLALAAGLALGVVALTVEGIRLLRSGTI